MALTKCPHCKGGFFEIKGAEPRGAAYKSVVPHTNVCMVWGKGRSPRQW